MKNLHKNKFTIKLFSYAMSFGNWLQQIPNKVTPPPFRLVQIGSAFWQSRALYVGAKLGLADEIKDSEKSTSTLSETLNLNEDHLYRLMRMLSSMGIFEETSHRVFKNSKISNYLRVDNPDNVLAMVLMHNSPQMTKPWTDALEESIRDGGTPFEKINNVGLFEYMDQNKDFDLLFSQAMDSVENVAGTPFLDDFNWGSFKRVIDVGGSNGAKAITILKSNPKLKAVVFDRPQVIDEAKNSWADKANDETLSRLQFLGGDMLENIPSSESDDDLYLFIAIFHGFSDSDCKTILLNLKTAIGDKSPYIVIMDTVADEINIDSVTASFDMQMLMGTKGRERTLKEWNKLFNNSGFKIEDVMDTRSFGKYIVIRPD